MKDTIIVRSHVPLEETDAFLKDKDRVQKYFEEKYGDCGVIHEQHETTDRQHRHEIVLQFLDPAVANKVKQKYNGRVLFGARTTTTFLTPPQTKNLRSIGSEIRNRPKSLAPSQTQYSNVNIKTERGRSRDRRGREMSEGRGTDTQSWAPSGGLERRSRDDREMQQHVAEDDQRYSSATPDLWDPRRSEMRFQEFDHQRCPSSSSSCDGRETRRVREMEGSQRHSDPDQRYGSSTDVREPRRSRELERHSDDQRYSSEPRKSQRSREMEVHSDPNQRYFASTDPKRTRELDTEQDQHYLSGDDRRRSRERDERDSRRSRESETLSDSGQLRYQSSASNTWFMVHQNRRPQQQQQNIFERLDRPQETREHSATYYAGEAVIVHDQRRPTRGKKRPAFSHQVGSFHKRRSTRSPARSDRGSVNCNSPALSSSSSERIFFDSRPSDSTASESPLIIIDELSQTPPSLPPPGTSSISSSPHPSCSLSPPPSPPALTQSPPSLLDIPFPSSPPSESNKPAPTSQTTQPSISQASTATTASQPPPQPPMPTYLSISPPLSSPSLQASPILVPMPISYPAGQGYQYQFFPPLQGFYPTVPTQVYSWPYASQVSTTAVVPSNPSRFDRSRSGTPVMDEPKDSTLVNAPAEETQTEETPAQQTDGQNPSHVDKEITQVDSENEQSFNAKMDVTENKTSSHTQETETHAQETLTEAQGTESHAQETLTEAQGTGTHAQETLTEAQGTETHVQEALTEAQGTETHAQEALTEAQGTETHAQETLTEAQGTETETHAQETLTETQGTETHVQEALTEPQGTETHNQKTDADVQVTDSHTQEPDVVMQLTEPHSKEDTVCQSSTDQTLEHDEQPAVETGAQSGDTLESHSQTTTDDIITQIVPISPASCPEQASEPSHTDNEPGDDGQLAVPSTMTDLEIEEAMEEEEDRGIDSDQESMTSEVFSPLTFQKTPVGVNYNLLKERFMTDYHEKAQILATSCEVLISQDPAMEDHVVKLLESSVKNLARKLLDQFREEAGITLD